MLDILVQVFGLILLMIALAWGYWRWVRPRPTLSIQAKLLLMLLVGAMVGGLIGSIPWWIRDPRSFSWLLPPLASRMLAVAGWSFAYLSFVTLQRPVKRRIRLALWMLATYFVPLVIAILLFHLDRFDPAAPITYVFFLIVTVMTALTLWNLLHQPHIDPDAPRDDVPSSAVQRYWLILVAVVMALWGLALFVTDNGPSPLIWVWPGDLLTSRLISVMLFTIAIGAIFGLNFKDTAVIMLWVVIVYGAGVTVANLWNVLASKPVQFSYVIMFALMAIVSAALIFTTRSDRA